MLILRFRLDKFILIFESKFYGIRLDYSGAPREEVSAVFRDLGHRISAVISEPRSHQFMLQRLSAAVHAAWHRSLRARGYFSVNQTGRSFLFIV